MNFKEWIKQAYGVDANEDYIKFSVYNMEAAYEAGKRSMEEELNTMRMKPVAYSDSDLSCGLSTTGITICGSKESIKKAQEALHSHQEVVPWMREEIKSLRAQLKERNSHE